MSKIDFYVPQINNKLFINEVDEEKYRRFKELKKHPIRNEF